MKISVVLSTYNQPEWLEKVLHGYRFQSHRSFEVVIADDGSDERTRSVLDRFRGVVDYEIQHVWQEDEGFQKSRILNKATLAARADYLVFSDGDCIPRRDFLAVHAAFARPGRFLSGGYCKLPMELSRRIGAGDIEDGRVFDAGWLWRNGMSGLGSRIKIGLPASLAPVMDALTPTKPTWNGHNASGWKSDLVAVNGYDEEMQYGGQDRELGERLTNAGIRGRQIRHRAVVLHLDHKRGYRTPESLEKNRRIREETRSSGRTWCATGIEKSLSP
jgi:glycosyltransferase involved in cell wall biosynthesis